MGVVSDYKEACIEIRQMCTAGPYRTSVLGSTGGEARLLAMLFDTHLDSYVAASLGYVSMNSIN